METNTLKAQLAKAPQGKRVILIAFPMAWAIDSEHDFFAKAMLWIFGKDIANSTA